MFCSLSFHSEQSPTSLTPNYFFFLICLQIKMMIFFFTCPFFFFPSGILINFLTILLKYAIPKLQTSSAQFFLSDYIHDKVLLSYICVVIFFSRRYICYVYKLDMLGLNGSYAKYKGLYT